VEAVLDMSREEDVLFQEYFDANSEYNGEQMLIVWSISATA